MIVNFFLFLFFTLIFFVWIGTLFSYAKVYAIQYDEALAKTNSSAISTAESTTFFSKSVQSLIHTTP